MIEKDIRITEQRAGPLRLHLNEPIGRCRTRLGWRAARTDGAMHARATESGRTR